MGGFLGAVVVENTFVGEFDVGEEFPVVVGSELADAGFDGGGADVEGEDTGGFSRHEEFRWKEMRAGCPRYWKRTAARVSFER